jgi:sugar/nucleoside kinase (ribokinase family)
LAPVALPPGWADAAAWILAPVAAELPDAWSEAVGVDAFMALGWQGLLRTLRAGGSVTRRRPETHRLVARADLVALSEHDIAPGTRPGDLASFLKPGAWLVVTAGAGGGIYGRVTAGALGAIARYAAFAVAGAVDATGAGDTFLAALVASLIHSAGPSSTRSGGAAGAARVPWPVPDVAFAAAAASFTVEGPGLAPVPDLAAVRRRLAGAASQSFAEPPSSST